MPPVKAGPVIAHGANAKLDGISLEHTERKLAAIMLADIAGYSALMERDEARTFARLRSVREQLIVPKVAEFGGRIIKTTGDGFLAEFPSATAALACGITIQRINHAQEANKDSSERLHFRIGINLGDIIIDGDDVSGDGVNVAARLEPLAPLDGICVSGAVRDQVREDLGVVLEDLGEQHVKNISRPIRAFRINLASVASTKPVRKMRWKAPLAAIGLFAVVSLAGWTWLQANRTVPPHLSIVILPFGNASGDSNQDYVADAITDDVTIELSKIKGSFVIGRGTAFSFKGKAVDLKAIARQLNVRYILQGSAARSDNDHFRATVQLIDGTTGSTIWADNIDKEGGRANEIRRDIVVQIARTLNLQLISAEARLAGSQNAQDVVGLTMKAHEKFNQGRLEKNNILEAMQIARRALSIQNDYEPALVLMANLLATLTDSFPDDNFDRYRKESEEYSRRAIKLDPSDAEAHLALANVLSGRGSVDFDAQLSQTAEALRLNPNSVGALAMEVNAYILSGKPALALPLIDRILMLSPLDPEMPFHLYSKCWALFHLARFSDAAPYCERSASVSKTWYNLSHLLAMHTAMGNVARANAIKRDLLIAQPDFSIGWYEKITGSRVPEFRKGVELYYLPNLRKAGIRE